MTITILIILIIIIYNELCIKIINSTTIKCIRIRQKSSVCQNTYSFDPTSFSLLRALLIVDSRLPPCQATLQVTLIISSRSPCLRGSESAGMANLHGLLWWWIGTLKGNAYLRIHISILKIIYIYIITRTRNDPQIYAIKWYQSCPRQNDSLKHYTECNQVAAYLTSQSRIKSIMYIFYNVHMLHQYRFVT